jgi:hypothetical protein
MKLQDELHNSCIPSAIIIRLMNSSRMNWARLLTPACRRGDGIVDISFGELGLGKRQLGRPNHGWKDIFFF